MEFVQSVAGFFQTYPKTSERGDTNMEDILNKDIAIEDVDSANKINSFLPQNEIDNNDLVATDVDMLSSSKLVITYTNKTEYSLNYGKGYVLQLFNNDNWEDISTLPGVGWKDVALNLHSGKSFEEVIDLKLLYGELKTGHYKIIKEMFMESSKISVTVEFEI